MMLVSGQNILKLVVGLACQVFWFFITWDTYESRNYRFNSTKNAHFCTKKLLHIKTFEKLRFTQPSNSLKKSAINWILIPIMAFVKSKYPQICNRVNIFFETGSMRTLCYIHSVFETLSWNHATSPAWFSPSYFSLLNQITSSNAKCL